MYKVDTSIQNCFRLKGLKTGMTTILKEVSIMQCKTCCAIKCPQNSWAAKTKIAGQVLLQSISNSMPVLKCFFSDLLYLQQRKL